MKFCISWLKDYLEFDAGVEELCQKLTAIGLEVEDVIDESEALREFEVAKIIDAKKHENSDKLSICKVKTASGEDLQIVCGAKNARAGIKIALAKIGSVIPTNKMVIKKAKVAGVESFGMMCSASELGVGEDGEGIIEIDEKWDVGAKISEIYEKDDAVIDVNITPNRGDCLGVYGIARDLSAAGFGVLKDDEFTKLLKSRDVDVVESVHKITAQDACKLALFREIKGVKNCQSPKWLKDRLEKIGQNSISAIVDVTNYVMFCLNRPMHAYDAAKIKGEIDVRFSKKGEEFHSLKDEKYVLGDDILCVCDQENVVGIAGVIGSEGSSCDLETNDILLESAFFDADVVAYCGRKLNILSDARYRFERGVDHQTCLAGIEMATRLILDICGGSAEKISQVKSAKFDDNLREIEFDLQDVEKVTGVKVDEGKSLKILSELGFDCDNISKERYSVKIPPYRNDVRISADLIEEVIRIYGYDKILPKKIDIEAKKVNIDVYDKVRSRLMASGMVENINWSFCDLSLAEKFGEIRQNLTIANPISENLNYMRPNLIIGLLNSCKKNTLRGFVDGSFFEIGRVFINSDEYSQPNMISGIRIGKNLAQNHYNDDRDFDIFDVKKDIFDVVEIFGLKSESLQISNDNAPSHYHPHRSGVLKLGKNVIANFGELHPKISKEFGIKFGVNIFEIFAENLPSKVFLNKSVQKKAFESFDLQPIFRDFAFVMDKEQKIGDLTKTIKNCDKKLIKEVDIFDIYEGKNIVDGKKSVALRVVIQPLDRNLTSQEIDEIATKIIDKVLQKHVAVLRS